MMISIYTTTYPYGNRRGAIGDPLANISVRYDLLGRVSTLFLGGSAIVLCSICKKIEPVNIKATA